MEQRKLILDSVPSTNVTGNIGRSSSYEVKVNGKLIFSKLKLGGFPSTEEVLRCIREAAAGEEPKELAIAERPECSIL